MINSDFESSLARLINLALKTGVVPHHIIGTLSIHISALSQQVIHLAALKAQQQNGGIIEAKVLPREMNPPGGGN